MSKFSKKFLIVLDLDNTLIFSTYYPLEQVEILLEFPPLVIHKRPYARELVYTCQQIGDIIVFTTAVEDYAKKVCNELKINYIKLFLRKNCRISNGLYVKYLEENWLANYHKIIIIDDSPEVWDYNARENCIFYVPEKFTGEPHDKEMKTIIDGLKENHSEG